MAEGRSAIAQRFIDRKHDARTAEVYGVAVHTTGSGVVEKARAKGIDPLERAIQAYTEDEYFAHYVVGWDGTVVQIADENVKALHIGFAPAQRASFLDGSWTRTAHDKVVTLW